MIRRKIILGLGALPLAWPGLSTAQGTNTARIGFLATSNEATARPVMDAFRDGLETRGYRSGRNLVLDVRYADGDLNRLSALADELIALKPHVLVGAEPAAVALKRRTSTIPIVLLVSADPVAAGLVHSLSKPGTNVTGLANRFEQIVGKHVELLREINPKISRAVLLSYSARDDALWVRVATEVSAAGPVRLSVQSARDEGGLQRLFKQLENDRPDALLVVPTPSALQLRREIIAQARRLRLPTVAAFPPAWVEDGGMMSYGANSLADYRYAASFVDRILKGASPAEMPIEHSERFELLINLRTAREIGITVPRAVLSRADRVIE